ncbi:maltose/maltodextrin ABC transporter periplasmic protein [Fictibacillus macauensis ZFHKF-1]|uniref:Maltose/maltodextrin ABC transporter periplasmic protein n=1 Tax=Fictibacillus macauensis ZFHKF-1 TaxID=1196324 RepID=I8UCP7_9BACL|nr:extracellular solute-binding protein [Fictibacillus macauensis]EIT84553.1 maltose/maltodextrin ABC transporter periplasmic protein [Fictibacillus macauensis ZFHKF-1]
MKKFSAVLLTTTLALGALSACGPKDSGSSSTGDSDKKPEKLVVWEDKDKSAGLKPAVESFEKKYGVKVEFKEMPLLDQQEKLRLQGKTGNSADVITSPHDRVGPLVTEGLIEPINVSDDVKKMYTESSIKALTFKGKLYGLPKSTETPVFIYNKKYMKKAPATFDDVYKFSKGDKGGAQYGFLANWTDFYFASGVVNGFGGYVFKDSDGTLDPKDVGLATKGSVDGLTFISKWYKEGLFPTGIIGKKGGQTIDGLFGEKKVASVMNGPWSFKGYKDAGVDLGIAPMPKLPNGQEVKTFVGVKGWNVSAYSTHKKWAQKLVEWITNKENSKIRFEKTQEIPPVNDLIKDPVITKDEGAKAVAIQSQHGIPMPNIPEMAEVWDPGANALQLVATGKQEPQKALEDAKKSIDENIQAKHSGK